jgi:hypothetical protein
VNSFDIYSRIVLNTSCLTILQRFSLLGEHLVQKDVYDSTRMLTVSWKMDPEGTEVNSDLLLSLLVQSPDCV